MSERPNPSCDLPPVGVSRQDLLTPTLHSSIHLSTHTHAHKIWDSRLLFVSHREARESEESGEIAGSQARWWVELVQTLTDPCSEEMRQHEKPLMFSVSSGTKQEVHWISVLSGDIWKALALDMLLHVCGSVSSGYFADRHHFPLLVRYVSWKVEYKFSHRGLWYHCNSIIPLFITTQRLFFTSSHRLNTSWEELFIYDNLQKRKTAQFHKTSKTEGNNTTNSNDSISENMMKP